MTSARVYAWGANSHGQTGTNRVEEELLSPVPVTLSEQLSSLIQQCLASRKSSDGTTGDGANSSFTSGLLDGVLITGGDDGANSSFSSRLIDGGVSTTGNGDSVNSSFTSRPIGEGVSITGGGGHTVLVAAGRAFTCGLNDAGQLGRPTEDTTDPQLRPVHLNEPVWAAACGWDHTLFLTSSGKVLAAGSDRHGQCGLQQTAAAARQRTAAAAAMPAAVPGVPACRRIAAGLRHSAAVTELGQLLTWGDNSRGQCGHGHDHVTSQNQRPVAPPQPVHRLAGVAEVACGQRHTVAIATDQQGRRWLFGMGDNRRGQIKPAVQSAGQQCPPGPCVEPSLVELPDDVIPARIHCGWTHTVLQCASGHLIGWGRSDYGQLALPRQLVRCLHLGSEHAAALTDTGRLLAWGWNEHGTCGTGDISNVVASPADITSGLPGIPVLVGAGYGCSFVVCAVEDGDVSS